MPDRRRYFRIDDYLLLDYERVEPQRRVETIELLRRRIGAHKHEHQLFKSIETQIASLLKELGHQQPEVTKVLKLLNAKLNMLEEGYLQGDESPEEMALQQVSLSACGISFGTNESLDSGDCLLLELVLFPDYTSLRLLGDVIDCAVQDGSDFSYKVRIEFDFPRREDMETLIQHIMRKQGEELQRSREKA
jgi:hypothetical protein